MLVQVGTANDEAVMTYSDKTITFSGSLADYDYDAILRDKQRNIVWLYELVDYFVDPDPIYHAIIKGVYTPFALHNPYRLVGSNEKVKAKYEKYYDRIHLHDRIRSIYFQYFKYGNVFVYLMEDGNLITLPVEPGAHRQCHGRRGASLQRYQAVLKKLFGRSCCGRYFIQYHG